VSIVEELRVCLGCREEWPTDGEFYRQGSPVCLACEAEGVKPPKTKARGYRTPEAERLYQREKYARHREAYLARMRRWYEENRVEINAKRRAQRAAKVVG
jgi:hypothetical protein